MFDFVRKKIDSVSKVLAPVLTMSPVVITLAITGCAGQGYHYANRGIGPSLYSSDIAKATSELNIYLGYLCDQTGYSVSTKSDRYPRCNLTPESDARWNLVVHTGFNDIDRRCDAYLAWVDDMRRRGTLGNQALGATRSLTNYILEKTVPAGAIAIGIVGEAFGFTTTLFNEYNKFLLLGFEGSTIESIVTARRTKFRSDIARNTKIGNKPDTVNVLSSYLRICMPYTITMNVNDYARAIATDSFPTAMAEDARRTDTLVEITHLDRSDPNFQTLKTYIAASETNAKKALICGSAIGLSKDDYFRAVTSSGDANRSNRTRIIECLKSQGEL